MFNLESPNGWPLDSIVDASENASTSIDPGQDLESEPRDLGEDLVETPYSGAELRLKIKNQPKKI